MKLLRGVSRHSNAFRSTGPRYFMSTVSERTSAVNKIRIIAIAALIMRFQSTQSPVGCLLRNDIVVANASFGESVKNGDAERLRMEMVRRLLRAGACGAFTRARRGGRPI